MEVKDLESVMNTELQLKTNNGGLYTMLESSLNSVLLPQILDRSKQTDQNMTVLVITKVNGQGGYFTTMFP